MWPNNVVMDRIIGIWLLTLRDEGPNPTVEEAMDEEERKERRKQRLMRLFCSSSSSPPPPPSNLRALFN